MTMATMINFYFNHKDQVEACITLRRSTPALFVEQNFDALVNEIVSFVTKNNKTFDDSINVQYAIDMFKNAVMSLDDEYSEYEQYIKFIF